MKCTIETLDDAGDSAVSVRKIKAVSRFKGEWEYFLYFFHILRKGLGDGIAFYIFFISPCFRLLS